MKKIVQLTIVALITVMGWQANAQVPVQPVCGGQFFDTGGPNGNFMNNENYQVTILPDNPGDIVTATFTFVQNGLPAFDMLTVDIGNGIFEIVPNIVGTDPVSYTSIATDGSLTFNFTSTGVTPNPGWEADITCSLPPVCPAVLNINVVPNSNTDVTITWDDAVNATNGYIIDIFNTGEDPMVDTPVTTQTVAAGLVTAIVTGLMGPINYDAYVTADCGADGLSNAIPVPFQTDPIQPFCGDPFFDSGGPGNDFMNNEAYQVTILPDNAGDLVTTTFTFVDNGGGASDMLMVDIGDGNFQLVPDLIFGDPPIVFTSIAADGSLIFDFVSSGQVPNPGWMANITCGPPVLCPAVTNIVATATSNTSATITWDEEANATNGYIVAVFIAGADPMVDTPVNTQTVATGTLTAMVTGLSGMIDYDVYVTADCDTDGISTVIPVPFTTIATIICGDQFSDTGGINGSYQNNENYSLLITPDGTFDLLTLDFLMVDIETGFDFLRIYDGDDTTATELSDTVLGVQATGQFSSTIPGGNLFITFTSDATVSQTGWIANVVCVTTAPDCEGPENFTITSVEDTTANLTWDEAPTAIDGYQTAVFLTGDVIGVDTPIYVSPILDQATTSDTATGLTAQVAYDAYIISICDVDLGVSALSGPITFNTILSIEDSALVSFTIFPNPTSNVINLSAAFGIENIVVSNILGQRVLTNNGGSQELALDISSLQVGTYFIKATVNGIDVVEKFVKR